MNRILAFGAIFLAAACNPAETNIPAPAPLPMGAPGAVVPVQAPVPIADTETHQSETPQDVLSAWAQALETRDWATARAQWGDHGDQSGLSEAEFAASYAKYKTIDVAYDDAEVEGAAGSLYYQADVTMTGQTIDDQPFRLMGPVTVKRVNDVPGATPEQLRWHITTSDLKLRPLEPVNP